ncbi:hypothetical protein Bca101_079904 [Brassica carinata]
MWQGGSAISLRSEGFQADIIIRRSSVISELKEKLQDANQRSDVKAIVLTGKGGIFSGGFDLNVFHQVHKTGDMSLMPDISFDLVGTLMEVEEVALGGKEMHLIGLKEMQKPSGSISFIHVADLARAHLFLTKKETASGRYIFCSHNTNVPEIADFLRQRYPHYNVISEFEECLSSAKLTLSSEKNSSTKAFDLNMG